MGRAANWRRRFLKSAETLFSSCDSVRSVLPVCSAAFSSTCRTVPVCLHRCSGLSELTPPRHREERPRALPADATSVLFTKPANEEQFAIADQLARHGSVLVQGPPGTGKTHTI